MITVLRKHNRWIMIVIAILAIPFVFYFNKADLGAERTSDLGRIYDRTVTRVEFLKNVRLMNLANSLGLNMGQELAMAAATENDMYSEFTWNRLILHREAEVLGLRPTPGEITDFVKTLRPFRGPAGFDINKYTEFTQTHLPPLGFNESHIEELVSDQLSINRLKDLLGTGIGVSESESMEYYQRGHGKLSVAVVRLSKEEVSKDLKISDEDIAKSYETQKAQLKTEEKRRVEFVTFALDEAEKKLTGKEKIDALQKLANRANDFSQALLAKDASFSEVASKFQLPVGSTADFTSTAPDPKLAATPQLTQYAFVLTQPEPYSDPIQGTDGFFLLHLLAITEARPLSLEEAKPKIVESLKAERLRELLSTKGAEIARQIRESLKASKPLDQALPPGSPKLERVPPFSLVESPPAPKPEADKEPSKEPKVDTPDLQAIKSAVSELSPGEVTEFVPTDKGGLVAVLEKREPADPAGYPQAKQSYEASYLQRKRMIVFFEWLRERRRLAGVLMSLPGT